MTPKGKCSTSLPLWLWSLGSQAVGTQCDRHPQVPASPGPEKTGAPWVDSWAITWNGSTPILEQWLEQWLVGGWATPLKNISQLGWLFSTYAKIKNVPNHQPDDDSSIDQSQNLLRCCILQTKPHPQIHWIWRWWHPEICGFCGWDSSYRYLHSGI